jgi:hypothetical protein
MSLCRRFLRQDLRLLGYSIPALVVRPPGRDPILTIEEHGRLGTANSRPARGATPPLKGVDQGLGPKLPRSDAFLQLAGAPKWCAVQGTTRQGW